MASPTDPFLVNFNSDIETKIDDTTELVDVVLRYHYPKTVNVEEIIQKMYSKEAVKDLTILPKGLQCISINGVSPTSPSLNFYKIQPIIEDTDYLVDVTTRYLAIKGEDVEYTLATMLAGSKDRTPINRTFKTQVVKEGTCAAPIMKVLDITEVL